MAGEQSRLHSPVEDVMTRRVVLVLERIPMSEFERIAAQYDYNGFPVVTVEGRLVGMITKGDLLRAVQAALGDSQVWAQSVSRWMAHGILALRAKDTVESAIAAMVESGLRSLPVIDDQSRVVGIVSRGDVMAAVEGRIES